MERFRVMKLGTKTLMRSVGIIEMNSNCADNVWGVFKGEGKFRFHCTVEINGKEEMCYLPSNCKLEKLVKLEGKRVLLERMESDKFSYYVRAVCYRNALYLLNLQEVNKVIDDSIQRRIFDFIGNRENTIREKQIEGYKADIFIPCANIIIENKAVLTFNQEGTYPTMNSRHVNEQLRRLSELLNRGYKVYLFIVGLGVGIKKIKLDETYFEEGLLHECRNKGLEVVGFNLGYRRGEFYVKGVIPVELK